MGVLITLNKKWLLENLERFEKEAIDSGENEGDLWIDLPVEVVEELSVSEDGELNLSLVAKGDVYVGVDLNLSIKQVASLLEDLSALVKPEVVVKKARPSGTGAVLYVPKDWDGHTVVAVKLG